MISRPTQLEPTKSFQANRQSHIPLLPQWSESQNRFKDASGTRSLGRAYSAKGMADETSPHDVPNITITAPPSPVRNPSFVPSHAQVTVRTSMDPLSDHLQDLAGDAFSTALLHAAPGSVSGDSLDDAEESESSRELRMGEESAPSTASATQGKHKVQSFFQRFRKDRRTASDSPKETETSELDLEGRWLNDADDDSANVESVKSKINRKAKRQFENLARMQVLGTPAFFSNDSSESLTNDLAHVLDEEDAEIRGPVWALRFSADGRYLAQGGQDGILRVWRVVAATGPQLGKVPRKDLPASGMRSDAPTFLAKTADAASEAMKKYSRRSSAQGAPDSSSTHSTHTRESSRTGGDLSIFEQRPYRIFRGHSGPILDISWSRNGFIASASMDKTVRIWHTERSECLCCFMHKGCVTSVRFHPTDDRYVLTGSLDSRVRVWSLEDKRVCAWNEMPNGSYVTAVSFTRDGSLCVAGTFTGDCIFYEFDGLKYNTQIQVRSTRDKLAKRTKITGIEPLPCPRGGEERLLVTSNDSRVRLYNVRDKSLHRKYRGLECRASQIKASFSDDGIFIISGSEDKQIYIWNTYPPGWHSGTENYHKHGPFSSIMHWQSDVSRSASWEKFSASDEAVTCAIFAPKETRDILNGISSDSSEASTPVQQPSSIPEDTHGAIIVSADMAGRLRVFQNTPHQHLSASTRSSRVVSTASFDESISVSEGGGTEYGLPKVHNGPEGSILQPKPRGIKRSVSELANYSNRMVHDLPKRSVTPPHDVRAPSTRLKTNPNLYADLPETYFPARTSVSRASRQEARRGSAPSDCSSSATSSMPEVAVPSDEEMNFDAFAERGSVGSRPVSAPEDQTDSTKYTPSKAISDAYRTHSKHNSIEEEDEDSDEVWACPRCGSRAFSMAKQAERRVKCLGCGVVVEVS
ncbi:WD40-repeat-containing domain protein [Gaertneriomyces semiglobifer]|nr:WD40-repeat-containing domain protein [Gaertneriomyces semiglobifer]